VLNNRYHALQLGFER